MATKQHGARTMIQRTTAHFVELVLSACMVCWCCVHHSDSWCSIVAVHRRACVPESTCASAARDATVAALRDHQRNRLMVERSSAPPGQIVDEPGFQRRMAAVVNGVAGLPHHGVTGRSAIARHCPRFASQRSISSDMCHVRSFCASRHSAEEGSGTVPKRVALLPSSCFACSAAGLYTAGSKFELRSVKIGDVLMEVRGRMRGGRLTSVLFTGSRGWSASGSVIMQRAVAWMHVTTCTRSVWPHHAGPIHRTCTSRAD